MNSEFSRQTRVIGSRGPARWRAHRERGRYAKASGIATNGSLPERHKSNKDISIQHRANNNINSESWTGDAESQTREVKKFFTGLGILLALGVPIGIWIGFMLAGSMGL